MKPSHYKKVLGLAIGEQSLIVAEVIAGDRPQVRRVAELIYPPGVSGADPASLSKALGPFLKEHAVGARAAVIGIPLKRLVVKPKEVPPADDNTVAQMLRVEAEAEFSSELKDLVYDFAGTAAGSVGGPRSVLLVATPRKYIQSIEAMCEAARLQPLAVMPSALVLGAATAPAEGRNALVLAVGASGSELSSHQSGASTAMRHLRGPAPLPAFVSELRRAISTLGSSAEGRELILWDGSGLDATALGEELGMTVRSAELPVLGADTAPASLNGDGSRYAAAVALAMAGLEGSGTGVDFLHSRLAPPRQRHLPRWTYLAALLVVLTIAWIVYASIDLGKREAKVAELKRQCPNQAIVDEAQQFVSKVSVAEYWHGGEARYLACLRDLDGVIPEDQQTYATSLDIKAQTPPILGGGTATGGLGIKPQDTRQLSVTLEAKTSNPETGAALQDRLRHDPGLFTSVNPGPGNRVPRTDEWLFSMNFTYVPPLGDSQTGTRTNR